MISIRNRAKLLVAAAIVALSLAVPAAAGAQTPATDQYSPTCTNCFVTGGGGDPGGSGDPPATVGGLPFTGLDLAGMVLAATALAGAGVAIRRASRRSEPAA